MERDFVVVARPSRLREGDGPGRSAAPHHRPRRQHRHVDAVRPAVPEPPHHLLRRARHRAVERADVADSGDGHRRSGGGRARRSWAWSAPTSSASPTAAPSRSSSPSTLPSVSAGWCWPPRAAASAPCRDRTAPWPAWRRRCATTRRPTSTAPRAASYGGMTGRDLSMRRRMMAERHRHPPSAYGYTMQLLGTVGWSSLPFLSRIPHDTLVICGDDDPLIPVANAEMLARRIPRARLEICKRSGHLFLWDEAKRLAVRIGTLPRRRRRDVAGRAHHAARLSSPAVSRLRAASAASPPSRSARR